MVMYPRLKIIGHTMAANIVFAIIVVCSGCSPKQSDIIVAKVGDNPITLADYENLYEKSSGSREQAQAATPEEREKFLGLMTNFRLKLADAYRQGLDKRPEIHSEINQYKGSLAQSFLTDREVTSPGVKKMYDRRKDEIRANHILLNIPASTKAEDTLAVYQKAKEIISKLKAGADFATLAIENSKDPSVKQNKGDLYYFTGGQMVPAFEDAAVGLKPGEISPSPIRTQYGLHVLKIVDRKPAPGEVRCSHIMIRFEKQDPTPDDTAAAYAKIKVIQDSIAMGVDFAELAMRNSGDPGSASKGGDLDWFTRRRWIQSFDEVALGMKPGQVSGIVRTIYGYHLIKCTDARPPKTFEESKKDLLQLYQQVRFQDDYKQFLDNLKQEVHFSSNGAVASQFYTAFDSSKSTKDSLWAAGIKPELGGSAIIMFGNRRVIVDSVVAIIKSRPDMANTPLRAASLASVLDKIAEQLVFATKSETMEQDYPEFRAIMKEYTEGILLYQIEQEQVWNKIAVTDSGLHRYFDSHRDKFMFPDRVDFSSIRMISDSVAQSIHSQLKNGTTMRQIVVADSVRMAAPSSFQTLFAKGSSTITQQSIKVLATAAAELKKDPSLRLQLAAHPDTTGNKQRNSSLATKRLDALKAHLTKKLGIAEGRITLVPRAPTKATSADEKTKMNGLVDITVIGRKGKIIGGLENALLSVTTDERTEMADSLTVGGYSRPFEYENSFCIVKLNKKDPLRMKSFEETGTEVSSAFQEYESKRLEQEWLDGLKKQYPVMEYKGALKNAFVSSK